MSAPLEAAARLPADLPPPFDFALDALEAEGALLERLDLEERAIALLPPALARSLGLPEECHLAAYPDRSGEVGVGLGAPLLDRLVASARARAPAASARLTLDPPRPAHVRALAARFVLRNGLAEIVEMSMGTAVYVAASVSYVAESDDRREGLVRVTAAPDGGEPDEAVSALLDFTWPPSIAREAATPIPALGAAAWVARRSEAAVRAAVQPLMEDVARRHARDHDRIASYFAALIAEARAPRRKVDPQALEAKVGHLLAERDKKLRDLPERYALRVSSTPAALVCVEMPAALLSVRLRRRKAERMITLRVPAGARAVDRLACEGCGAATGMPAACDLRVHILCESCAPSAQGRVSCPACGQAR